MGPKRPFVSSTKHSQKSGAQFRNFLPSRAFHPQETWMFQFHTITDMSKFQGESAEPLSHAPQFLDRIRYRFFIPRRHQREMDVGGRGKMNWK
jgi:hypothetical protein